MERSLTAVLCLAALVVAACEGKPEGERGAASPGSTASGSMSPRSAEELADAFVQASEVGDTVLFSHLVYWEGVDSLHRDVFWRAVSDDFGRPVDSAWVGDLDPSEKLEYELGGVVYRPSLRPKGRLHLHFGDTAMVYETSYLVGVDNGRWLVTLVSPVEPTQRPDKN